MNRLFLISPDRGDALNQFFLELVIGNWELGIANGNW